MTDPDVVVPGRSRTSLQRRVDIALLVGGALVVSTVLAAVVALVAVRERQHEVLDTYFLSITETDRTYLGLVNAETGVRGYLLTGDESTLEPFIALSGGEVGALADVDTLLAETYDDEHPVMQTRGEALEAVRRWYAAWATPMVEVVRAEGPEAVTPADVERGRQLFDDVRGPVEEHSRLLRVDRAAAADDLMDATWVLVGAVVLLAVLLVAGGLLLRVFLRRWVTRPLEHLAEDVRVVAGGDMTHGVTTTGTGEVAEVSAVVESMRRRLVRSIRETDDAKVALEESHERLRQQTEDLARSNRDLEQFAYVASHDLQEPLRKVASFTQLLAKRYEGQLDERADQYIGFAVDGAKRMQRLINDLLGFSRVGRIGGEVTDVDMQELVEQVADDLAGPLEEAGGRVVAEGLPTVRGEEPLLRQLVTNLVGNAIKFRHPERPPEIRIGAREEPGHWELTCSDNGIGIDPQYADRVFVIFQRLHAKEVYEGTGIGLALCKKIVEYHGGDIWIAPGDGEGTTVRWTLPVDTTADEATTDEARAADDTGDTDHAARLTDGQEVTA